jgi:hypothetical protein
MVIFNITVKSHNDESLIHIAVCFTTDPKPLPNPALHIVRSRASYFRCDYPLRSLRSSSSFLRLLPRVPVTSIPPFIFPSITCRRRQFPRKMWPIQLAFRSLIYLPSSPQPFAIPTELSRPRTSCIVLNLCGCNNMLIAFHNTTIILWL